MSMPPPGKDLIVLVADGQMQATVDGILTRGQALRFREITSDVYPHPEKDPGCLLRAQDFLRPFCRQYSFAMVVFDREGCGRQSRPREALEAEVEERLALSGWKDRSAAIVLDPELEIWVWSNSPEVDAALGWANRSPSLAEWLVSKGFLTLGQAKPKDPKRAVEEALRVVRKGRSSAIYRSLAQRVSVSRCTDPAFQKFTSLLTRWFGVTDRRS